MKKARYITPETILTEVEVTRMICNSVTAVGGDANIGLGEGEAPNTADSRRRNVWDDEMEEEEDY